MKQPEVMKDNEKTISPDKKQGPTSSQGITVPAHAPDNTSAGEVSQPSGATIPVQNFHNV